MYKCKQPNQNKETQIVAALSLDEDKAPGTDGTSTFFSTFLGEGQIGGHGDDTLFLRELIGCWQQMGYTIGVCDGKASVQDSKCLCCKQTFQMHQKQTKCMDQTSDWGALGHVQAGQGSELKFHDIGWKGVSGSLRTNELGLTSLQ